MKWTVGCVLALMMLLAGAPLLSAATFTGNDRSPQVEASGGGGLTPEEVQDIVGAMAEGGTQTRINVAYDDPNGWLDFVVDLATIIIEGDTWVGVTDTGDGFIIFVEDNTEVGRFTGGNLNVTNNVVPGGITMTNNVDEFSTDGTLGDNSNTALPTERAVKTYVDTTVGTPGLWREIATDNFFGPASAGAALTTGDYNTVGGVDAAAAITTPSYMTVFGYKAAESLTITGSFDTYLGAFTAQNAVTSGGYNIGAGYQALNSLAAVNPFDAAYNIGFGNYTGYNISEGHDNTLIGGDRTGLALRIGDYNTALGSYALSDEQDGLWNTALGAYALEDARGGTGNTAVGGYSMEGTHGVGTGINGNYNSSLGYGAGRKLEGNASRNLFLGSLAGPTAASTFNDRGYVDIAADDSPLIGMDFSGRKVGIETAHASMTANFTVTGTAEITGGITQTPSAAQVIDAVGDAILANAGMVVLNPDGNYTLTSTPTIADGTTGEIVYVTCANAEANTVTVQDQDTLGGSNLQLGAVNRAVSGKDVLCLLFDGTDWLEVSYANN